MNTVELSALLSDLPLGAVRYLPTTGSTNDVARQWLAADAPDLALVTANEQTAGRGQAGRTWQSPAGTCIALSLILRNQFDDNPALFSRLTALGALAVCEALGAMNLSAQIKWPNDVLLDGRKVAGVLAEGTWVGENLEGVVLGIGVNVLATSITHILAQEGALHFPSVSIEEIAGYPPDRWQIMVNIVRNLVAWRASLYQPIFLKAWEGALAFRGKTVRISTQTKNNTEPVIFEGILAGLAEDGALRLKTPASGELVFHAGDVRLLPPAASPEPVKA